MTFDYDPHTHARTDDPQTSKDAAAGAAKVAVNHAAIILNTLLQYGPAMTAKEIAAAGNLRLDQVYRRRNDLQRAGMIRVTDEVRDGCNVWEAL